METKKRSTGVAASQNPGGGTLSHVEQAHSNHRSNTDEPPTKAASKSGPKRASKKLGNELSNTPLNEVATNSEETKQKPQSAYDAMTQAATLKAAAIQIANPGFPQAEQLPRIASLPFVNMGNMVLFDYFTFGKITWSLALKIKELRKQFRNKNLRLLLLSLTFSGLVVAITPYIAWSQFSVPISFSIPEGAITVFALTLLGMLIGSPLQHRKLLNTTKKARLESLRVLLANQCPPCSDPLEGSDTPWIGWGEGRIGGPNLPVLIALEGNKFPGFGHLQIHQLLVCQPRHKSNFAINSSIVPKKHLSHDISPLIHKAMMNTLVRSNFPNTMIGSVVVVDGSSISKDSPWLDDQGRPLLRISQADLPRLKASHTPMREYWAIQILFPNQSTAATLFVRSFAAGQAVAVELNLVTLGPIAGNDKNLRECLNYLEAQINGKNHHPARLDSQSRSSPYATLLRSIRNGTRDRTSKNSKEFDSSKIPDPSLSTEQKSFDRDARALQSHLTYWTGNWPELSNWREKHSLPISDQYFGNAECRATIRSLYETIVEAILDELNDRGFETSNYRDRERRMTIQVENIDQLAIGHDGLLSSHKVDRHSPSSEPSPRDLSPKPEQERSFAR